MNLFSLGGFRLTMWISNDKDLLNAIPVEERAQSVGTIGEEGTLPIERSLRVIWDVQKDFSCPRSSQRSWQIHGGKLSASQH